MSWLLAGLFLLVPLAVLTLIGLVLALVVHRVRARSRTQADVVAWAASRGWSVGGDGPDLRSVDCRPVRDGGRPGTVVRGATPDGPVLVTEWARGVDRAGITAADASEPGTVTTTVEHTAVVAITAPGRHDHALVEIYRGRRPRRVGRGAPDVVDVAGLNPACTVLAGDPAAAPAVLPPDVLGRLAGALRPGDGVVRHGGRLVGYRAGELDPVTADALLTLLGHVRADLARHAGDRTDTAT